MSGRKQITIPLGYDPNNNDIGNHSQVSGLNYEFWYALHDDVKTILGETSNDIGVLCRSANINKWAAFKPTRVSPETSVHHYHGMVAGADGDITYEGPRGANPDPRDLSQFLGYNHQANVPGMASHGPVGTSFQSTVTHEINCRLDLPEFDIRDVDAMFTIEKVYAKTYTGASYDTLQRTENVTIVDGDIENQEIYITAKVDLSGTTDINFKVVFTVGNDAPGANDVNYPSAAGGELALTGLAEYAPPPVATVGLGSSFDPADALIAESASINTSREYSVQFGDGNEWINLDAGGSYDGPFDMIVHKGPAGDPDWEVTIATMEYISIGQDPNWQQQGQLSSSYPVANGDNINFRIEKS